MRPRFKLWIEKDGQLVFSDWRAQLLRTIDESGSLSEAASRLGVHYRIAWEKLHRMEQRLGVKLVEGHSGGAGGGGANLTDAGRELLAKYERLTASLDEEVARRFAALFGEEG
ncbi:MAG: LysR family transcriptional regulator [Chloroflexi bacterium]|nr:LysR family transcriptional regulator [Chloroflexota bacterium]